MPALETAGGCNLVQGDEYHVYEKAWHSSRIVLLEFPSRQAWESFHLVLPTTHATSPPAQIVAHTSIRTVGAGVPIFDAAIADQTTRCGANLGVACRLRSAPEARTGLLVQAGASQS